MRGEKSAVGGFLFFDVLWRREMMRRLELFMEERGETKFLFTILKIPQK